MTSEKSRAWPVRRALSPALGILDSGISSIGNLLVSVVAARALDLRDFGLFSIGLVIGLMTVGMWRAMHSEPLVLSYAAADLPTRNDAARRALGSSLTSSLLSAPVPFALAFVVCVSAGAQGTTALWLALGLVVTLPALVAQDYVRFASYVFGRPGWAVVNSGVWTGSLGAMLVGLWYLADETPAPVAYLVVWGSSAAAGAAVAGFGLHLAPRFRGWRAWYREQRELIRRLLWDWGLLQVSAEGSSLILASIGGASASGVLRKAQIPLAPVPVMTNGVTSIIQPLFVRHVARGQTLKELRNNAWRIGGALLAAALVWGIVVYSAPVDWVRLLVGDDWDTARRLVPWLTAYLGLGALAASLGVALRAAGYLAHQVRTRQALLPVTLALVVLGSYVAGAQGAVIALTTSVALVVAAWVTMLELGIRSEGRAGDHVG